MGLVASSSEYFLAKILEICALFGLLLDVFRLLADFGDFGVGLADRFKEDVLDVDAIFNFVLVDVGVVIGAQNVVTDLGVSAELIDIEESVAGGAFLRHLIFRGVLLEIGGKFRVGRMNRGREFLGLDCGVLNLDLFVAAAEFLFDFSRADGDAVGDELAESFEEHLIAQEFFELADAHSTGAHLDFGGVAVFEPSVTGKDGGENLLDAVRHFFRGYGEAEALSFEFEGVLKNHLIEDLLGVHALEHGRNVLAARDLIQLALDVGCADVNVSNFGDSIGAAGGRGIHQAGNERNDHTEADDDQDHGHGDFDPAIAIQISLLNTFQHSSKRPSTDSETLQL